VFSYWRWYVNAPATGANPASDWWQVEVTNDAGNTWQYLENTSQQDISWRRKAFRVADVLDLTNSFQIRFIASDSTTIGEYLDGGSLVEAAVDDIVLYDLVASGSDAVESTEVKQPICFPNPTTGVVQTSGWMPGSTLRVYDLEGREVLSKRIQGKATLTVASWPQGMYVLKGVALDGSAAQVTFETIR